MPALSEYANVYNTALVVLTEKGYQVWFDETTHLFCAEKDGWDFCGDSPTGLLGVVAIFEHSNPLEYKEYWWRRRDPALYVGLPRQPRPYISVTARRVDPKE